jgi:hypothetical protein
VRSGSALARSRDVFARLNRRSPLLHVGEALNDRGDIADDMADLVAQGEQADVGNWMPDAHGDAMLSATVQRNRGSGR